MFPRYFREYFGPIPREQKDEKMEIDAMRTGAALFRALFERKE